MKKSDLDEKVYYDDSTTKVTASFIAGYKKIILPIDRVTDVIISHKSYSMYLCFVVCVLLIILLFTAPFLPTMLNVDLSSSVIWYAFTPIFGACCIWFRFIYENYVELYIKLDDEKKYLLRVITLGKRTILYDVADAVRAAVADRKARTAEDAMLDTDSLKIRRLKNMLIQSNLDMTPEIMELLEKKPEKQPQEAANG